MDVGAGDSRVVTFKLPAATARKGRVARAETMTESEREIDRIARRLVGLADRRRFASLRDLVSG